MGKVNYITHLNTILDTFNDDIRIKQGHITLYLAFFHKWNRSYFEKIITVNRELIMERARIRSKTTYHRYLKDLNDWDYLKYIPSYHPRIGSKIEMKYHRPKIGTSPSTLKVQNLDKYEPEPSQNLAPNNKLKTIRKLNKQSDLNFNLKNVLLFFEENKFPEIEGRKFYIYVKAKKLKTDKWQSIAFIFAKNEFMLHEPERGSPFFGYVHNIESNGSLK